MLNWANPASVGICSLLLWASSILANDNEPLPNLEFFEYLGEWQNEEGHWVDPMMLEEQESLDTAIVSDGEQQ